MAKFFLFDNCFRVSENKTDSCVSNQYKLCIQSFLVVMRHISYPALAFLIVNVGCSIHKEIGDREEKFTLINLEGDIKCSSAKLKPNQDM